MYKCKLCK